MRPEQLETSENPNASEVSAVFSPNMRQIAWQVLLLAVALGGCSGTEPVSGEAPFYAGTFEASCSPVDAPGTLFEFYRLGDPEPAMVSISVWRMDFPIDGSRIELNGRRGYAAAFIGGTEWIPASDGAISFDRYMEGELARGWFWIQLDGIERIEGQFEASWSDTGPAICG